jgi:hypothetical protein
MSGTTSAGEILGTLRLSITDFETNIAKAQELADRLDGKNVVVNVKVDTGGAETKLAAVAASEDKVGGSSKGASSGLTSVESAARKLADASSVANIAQLRLSEVQGSGTAKASSLASAHQSLTKAERDLSDVMKSSTPEVIRAAEAMKPLDDQNKKVAKSSKDAGNGMGLLSMAIVGLGPAIVPLAAGAAGLAVGFGAMGAAGVLAIVGISQQMKAGTPLGLAYSATMGTLKGDLTTLGATAAAGVLAPFQKEVATLQGQMPALNGIIGEFSVITGKTAGNLMSGLVAAFIALEPLARDVGVYVLDLSSKFATLMSGSGVTAFGDYIRSVFPQVMQTVESVVGAVVHLVAALAPMGLGPLSMLRTFADLINAIPVDVLSVLAQGAASVYIGFKTFSLLSGGITAVSTALQAVGVSAETAAVGVRALTIAAGVIGAVITVATLLYSAHAESVRKDQEAVNSLTDALIANKGAISDSTVADKANALAKDGTLAAAKALGYSIGDVTAASLGNVDASARVIAHSKLLQDGWDNNTAASQKLTGSTGDQADAFDKVNAATKDGVTNLNLAKQAYDAYNVAIATSAAGGNAQAIAQQALASRLGITAAALALAQDGQKKTADATANTAAKMYLEGDAAGILKTQLDILSGKSLSLMESQTADADATNKAAEAFKANGKAIDGNSVAAILNQQALQKKAEASKAEAEAVAKATGSTNEAIKAYQGSKTALEESLKAQGMLTPAVQAYIDKLYDVKNLKVPPTKLDVDKAAAEAKIGTFQKQIDAIKQGKAPGIDADSAAGKAVLAALQKAIDNIKQGKPPGIDANISPGQAQILAYQKAIDAIKQKLATGLDANPKAALLQIIDMQNKIDAIKQKLATALDANSATGKATIADMQAKIDAIKQNKLPGVDANTAAGKQKIAELQSVIDGIHGKTVAVEIQYTSKGVNLTTPSSVGRSATGGPISGAGTGTSDSILQLVSNGEHMLTAADVQAAGGHAAIFAYRKSLHQGYAQGGPIIITMPSASDISAAYNTGANNGATYFPPPIPPVGGGSSGGGGAAQWSSMVSQILAMLGQPASSLAGNLRRINLESSGNPRAINLTDSNAAKGTPSMGLMQTILSTFLAYAGPYASRGVYDPFANIYAGDNYAIHEYGSVAAVDPLVHPGGYDTGGMMMPGGIGKNYGTKAERVMSGSQTEWFEAGRAAAGKGGGGGGGNGATSADIAAVADEVRNLGQVIHAELQGHARTIQTMQRQMARA